jgi:TonB family protein
MSSSILFASQAIFPVRRPSVGSRLALFVVVACIQAAAVLALNHAVSPRLVSAPTSAVMVTTFISPRIRDDYDQPPGADLSQLSALLDIRSPRLDIEQPEIDFSVSRNSGSAIAAPTLEGGLDTWEIKRFARQAALLPGEGATVVLRIQVLASGDAGEVAVDVSSGSGKVDRAAVDYARTRHWYAGRVNGTPSSMWIRWGVRLQS